MKNKNTICIYACLFQYNSDSGQHYIDINKQDEI